MRSCHPKLPPCHHLSGSRLPPPIHRTTPPLATPSCCWVLPIRASECPSIGVLFGCFGREMDEFPRFSLSHLPGKPIYFTSTVLPLAVLFFVFNTLLALQGIYSLSARRSRRRTWCSSWPAPPWPSSPWAALWSEDASRVEGRRAKGEGRETLPGPRWRREIGPSIFLRTFYYYMFPLLVLKGSCHYWKVASLFFPVDLNTYLLRTQLFNFLSNMGYMSVKD